MKVFKSTLYAARGNSTAYEYSTDGDAFTTSTLTDKYANYFLVSPNSGGTAEVLWKVKTPNEVASAQAPINGATGDDNWTSPWYVGDTTNNITNIFLSNNNLLVGRVDGLWHLDSNGGTHNLRPDLMKNQSTDNFKYYAEWQAGVYCSEIDGMSEITAYNAIEPMGPLTKVADGPLGDIGKRGDIVGIAADKDWLYVAVDEGTNTIIYKGREVRKRNILMWEWCPWIFLGTKTTANLAVVQHSATDRRLWFGYTNSTAYAILSDNPTEDSAARFTTSGWLRMSYDYGSNPEWDKLWQSAVLEVTGGASGETVQIKYRADSGSSTECVAAAATNGIFETNFTSEIASNRIQFEIHLASDTSTATPEVSYFEAKGVEIPVTIRIHDCFYSMGNDPRNTAKTLRDLLRTARTTTTLLRFADLRYGDSTGGTAGTDFSYVVVEPGFPKEPQMIFRKDGTKELAVNVRFREVSFS
jgi:hypothetical protein